MLPFFSQMSESTQNIYHTITIDLDSANQRFDRFLRKFYRPYTSISLAMIYEWIRKWHIRINGKKGKEEQKILLGDSILINISKTAPLSGKKLAKKATPEQAELTRESIKKNILTEDDNRVVFNKPPHMLMHPGSGQTKTVTMNDRLYTYLNEQQKKLWGRILTAWSTFKPAFCFRLDKDTSGVLVAAKTYEALQYLNDLIREREVTKRYVTVVAGKLPNSLVINKPLFKWFHAEKGRAHMFVNYEKWVDSETHVYNLATVHDKTLGDISLGLVHLLTGRMHQIRIHLTSEGFPVLWDIDYGNMELAKSLSKTHGINRQLLHSFYYSFRNVQTEWKSWWGKKQIIFSAPLPLDIQKIFPTVSAEDIQNKILLLSKK